MEKRFADFGIKDPHQKYQLMVGLFGPEEQLKLAPYFSKGPKDKQYDNLIKGVKKLFAPDELEIASKAESIKFDGTDLPSTFANRVKTILVSGKIPYHDQHIKNMIINKFPAYLVDQLMHHKDKSLDDLMELADSFYITSRSVRKRHDVEAKKSQDEDQSLSRAELAVMTMLAQIQDSLKSQDSRINDLANVQKRSANCNTITQNVPSQTSRARRPAASARRNDFEVVENSAICKSHQIFGARSWDCVAGCKWNDITICPRHKRFAGKAFECVAPEMCQYEVTLRQHLN